MVEYTYCPHTCSTMCDHEQSWHSHDTVMIQSWYSYDTVILQSWYSHNTVMIQSWYSYDTVMIQSWYSHDTVMIQSSQDEHRARNLHDMSYSGPVYTSQTMCTITGPVYTSQTMCTHHRPGGPVENRPCVDLFNLLPLVTPVTYSINE